MNKYGVFNILFDLIKGVSTGNKVEFILEYLNRESPQDYIWEYSNYFFRVTVPYSSLDSYLVFIEDLVECKYTFQENTNDTITLLFSLDLK